MCWHGLLLTPCARGSALAGKIFVSGFVGICTAVSLWGCSVDLWLVFGLLAFWLNFIPNVGTVSPALATYGEASNSPSDPGARRVTSDLQVIAVALPLPLVILDPAFSTIGVLLVALLPLGAHAFAGNVIEPLLFGHTLKLHPVTVLLSLLFWGALWGITGMVMAVPMTAVMRIRLSHINHPLPQFLAAALVGSTEAVEADPDHVAMSCTASSLEEGLEDGGKMANPRSPLISSRDTATATLSGVVELTAVAEDAAVGSNTEGLRAGAAQSTSAWSGSGRE